MILLGHISEKVGCNTSVGLISLSFCTMQGGCGCSARFDRACRCATTHCRARGGEGVADSDDAETPQPWRGGGGQERGPRDLDYCTSLALYRQLVATRFPAHSRHPDARE